MSAARSQENQPQRVKLSTKVISSNGEELTVYANCKKDDYNYNIKLELENGQKLGCMRLFSHNDVQAFAREIKPRGEDYLVLDYVENYSRPDVQRYNSNPTLFAKPVTYKHVGKALDEFAFRYSFERGLDGRIETQAVRNCHLFHYLNGFRPYYGDLDRYYEDLMQDIYLSEGKYSSRNLGGLALRLPNHKIAEKAKEFGLDYKPDSEAALLWSDHLSEKNLKKIKHYEPLVDAGHRDYRTLADKVKPLEPESPLSPSPSSP